MNPTAGLPRWTRLVVLALVLYRVLYHLLYLESSPFALGTFSDGRIYEWSAIDIVEHPPLGTETLYLQGLYAYFLALPMTIRPRIAFGLLLQLVVAGIALWVFHRTATRAWGRRRGVLSTIVLLGYPMLAFYENKFVSAELGIACNVLAFATLGAAMPRPTWGRLIVCGIAGGLTVMARPNMMLALPFTAYALMLVAGTVRGRVRTVGAFTLGVAIALLPLAARNAAVTGRLTVLPAHGGGTSFYIGNNPDARGVWNDAGGLITGQVMSERTELVEKLQLGNVEPRKLPGEIGDALYRRAFEYIADQPGHFLWLQVRKVWLTLGNDELTQDYDRWGEREMAWWSSRGIAPFAAVLPLGVLGLGLVWRRGYEGKAEAVASRPWLWLALGQIVAILAANVVFFTSAQHRLPLVVPLAFFAGPGLSALWSRARGVPSPAWLGVPGRAALTVTLVLGVQSLWPRSRVREPSAVHYHNLALVEDWIGRPRQALLTLGVAVERRPDHPIIRLERARLARRMREFDKAAADLERISQLDGVATWIREQADEERVSLEGDRALAEELGLNRPRREGQVDIRGR